jgi:phospholipid/cholesterol/gamma-HCH transport system substrate-binding protein
MSVVRRQQRSELVKLTVFLAFATLIAVWLGAVMGEARPGDRAEYKAAFRDVSGLAQGDQVRVAGVNVGKVNEIEVREDTSVLVTFDVRTGIQLDQSTQAAVKYRNLLGDRILELTRPGGPGKEAAPLAPGATIPLTSTASALDLDTLLNGFKPLFAGLTANQVNELSSQLVQVLQGQGAAIENLVSTVGSFTTSIGQREELVTRVIGNLNQVFGTLDSRRGTVGALIDELSSLVTGLDRQDTRILDAAAQVDGLARDASRLVRQARGDFRADVAALALAARGLNSRADTIEALLDQLPRHYRVMQDSASYGNFFNFFLCGVRVQLTGDDGRPVQSPWILSDLTRCAK